MLKDDTVQPTLCGKKVLSVLCFFLVMVMFFSEVAGAASWSHYDSSKDAVIFDYTDAVGFMAANNFYMEVSFVKDNNFSANGVVVRRHTNLSGTYYATDRGLYTVRFYRPDGTQYLSNYQTNVTQVQNRTWDSSGYFGYDGTTSNKGTDPNGGGSNPPPPPNPNPDPPPPDNGGTEPPPDPEPDPPPPPPKTEETFDYGSLVGDWLRNSGGYMNVAYRDQYGVNHGTKSYRNLSGSYDMTANGSYTFEFFNSDGSRHAGPYTRYVGDLDIDSVEEGSGSFGRDQSGDVGDNRGCDCWFQAPAWNQYMGKLDEIRKAIPPPPNWNAVADTFYERIVPRAINDLRNMLGTAPPPPNSPAIIQPTNITTPSSPAITNYSNRLNQSTPQMQNNPALDNATFSADDIKSQAPVIEFREDESGGFNLPSGNPVDSLPDLPFSGYPMPGMGSAGEWDHQPIMPNNPFPMPSEDSSGGSGAVDPGAPPIPSGSGNQAPLPGQNYNPPTPGGLEIELGNYKKHPDDPDGSG